MTIATEPSCPSYWELCPPRKYQSARAAVAIVDFRNDVTWICLPRAAWLLELSCTQVTLGKTPRFYMIGEDRFAELLHNHIEHTALLRSGSFQVDASGNCEAPYHSHLKYVPTCFETRFRRVGELVLTTDLSTGMPVKARKMVCELVDMHHMDKSVSIFYYSRCRKCPDCLRSRRRLWMRRMSLRLGKARRSWFVTLTLGPHARARVRIDPKEVSKEVTRYLNRFRQAYYRRHRHRPRFKYVVAFERHKDGTPHVHLLVHENDHPITRRELEAPWRWGRVKNARLVDCADGRVEILRYMAKYMLKSSEGRIRASVGY